MNKRTKDILIATVALTAVAAAIYYAFAGRAQIAHCRSHDFHSGTFRHSVEFSAELVVVIAKDHVGTLAEWRDITKLLRRPLFGRCSSNPDVNDFAGLDVDHEESEQWPKPNIVDLQEVAGPNRMVREKRLPALPMRQRWRTHSPHVPLNGVFGDGNAQFEKLTADTFGSPEAVFLEPFDE